MVLKSGEGTLSVSARSGAAPSAAASRGRAGRIDDMALSGDGAGPQVSEATAGPAAVPTRRAPAVRRARGSPRVGEAVRAQRARLSDRPGVPHVDDVPAGAAEV